MLRALVFALMLTACAQASAPAPAPLPQPTPPPVVRTELGRTVLADLERLDRELSAPGVVAAGAGQLADLGNGLVVRPYAIIEDSRCPQNVECLWEGRMRIRASVAGEEVELILGQPLETPRGAVLFAVVSPSAWAEWPTAELGPRPAYRFGFRRA